MSVQPPPLTSSPSSFSNLAQDFLPSPLDYGGKGDSRRVFWDVFLWQHPMGVSHVWHSPGPACAGEEDDAGCSHSHQARPLLTHPQKSVESLLTGTSPQAGFSTPTGDSVAFPTVGGFAGSWCRPEIL